MDLNEAFRIVLTVVLSLALILDAMFLVFSFSRKIGTKLCTRMLRSQTAIDCSLMIVNLTTIQYFSLLPLPPQNLPDWLWLLYCKLIRSEGLHWSLVSMSVYNLVCIAIERCCCLCAPFWYRRRKTLLLKLFCLLLIASPSFVEFPFCWIVTSFVKTPVENSTELKKSCQVIYSEHDPTMLKAFGISYVVLFWALPSVLSVALYLIILHTIRQSTALRTSSTGTVDADVRKVSDATRRLTLMTGVTSGAFVLLFAMDSIDLLLLCLGVHIQTRGFIDSLDSFLVNLNSAINPLMYLVFMPDFRSFISCLLVRGRGGG